MNHLYGKAFFLYQFLYFVYKRISDRKRIRLIKRNVKKGMTALDIGANIGFYSLLLSRYVGPSGKVIAFEPEERNFSKLTKMTKKKKNIFIHRAACGATSGTLDLFLSNDMNIDHQTYDSGENRHVQAVPCVALDDELTDNQNIGFIKIDIQGYDYFAMLGLQRIVRRSNELTIIGEFWPYALKKAGVEPIEYINLLEKLGLKCHFFRPDLDPFNSDKVENKYFYTDFYALKQT